jgi:hypothetical protein
MTIPLLNVHASPVGCPEGYEKEAIASFVDRIAELTPHSGSMNLQKGIQEIDAAVCSCTVSPYLLACSTSTRRSKGFGGPFGIHKRPCRHVSTERLCFAR